MQDSDTSHAVGIARKQGKLPDLQSNLLELFPQYSDIANLDHRKQAMNLEQVLTMTTGFEWDEFTPGHNSSDKMAASEDWIKHVLDLPMSDAPGEKWVYNSGNSLLLSDILRRSTGETVDEFARRHLFEPIGIESWNWSVVRNDVVNTTFGLAMTRRDMARFGVLYLNGGRWQGQQIVSEDWVKASTAAQVLGFDGICDIAYGYQWWRLRNEDPFVQSLDINDQIQVVFDD